MTPSEALLEVLERLGAGNGVLLLSEEELSRWPVEAGREFKSQRLLVRASPAASTVCPGCEQQCVMPVHTPTGQKGEARSFVVCDKRDDINRVDVATNTLRQWSVSLAAVGQLTARLLGLSGPVTVNGQRCEVGVLRGRLNSSHTILVADGELRLHFAGHAVDMRSVLTFEDDSIRLDVTALRKLVDRPVAAAGDGESAAQRQTRIRKLVQIEKNGGNKAFLKTVAERENISVSRLKQILASEPKQARKTAPRTKPIPASKMRNRQY